MKKSPAEAGDRPGDQVDVRSCLITQLAAWEANVGFSSTRVDQPGDCPVAKSKADEYRDKARECEELAQVARYPLVQQQILEIAEKWRTMAAFEEKFER